MALGCLDSNMVVQLQDMGFEKAQIQAVIDKVDENNALQSCVELLMGRSPSVNHRHEKKSQEQDGHEAQENNSRKLKRHRHKHKHKHKHEHKNKRKHRSHSNSNSNSNSQKRRFEQLHDTVDLPISDGDSEKDRNHDNAPDSKRRKLSFGLRGQDERNGNHNNHNNHNDHDNNNNNDNDNDDRSNSNKMNSSHVGRIRKRKCKQKSPARDTSHLTKMEGLTLTEMKDYVDHMRSSFDEFRVGSHLKLQTLQDVHKKFEKHHKQFRFILNFLFSNCLPTGQLLG